MKVKSKVAVVLNAGGFDSIKSAVIISRVFTALFTLLMITAEYTLLIRPVFRFTVSLFFLLELFSSYICCIVEINSESRDQLCS